MVDSLCIIQDSTADWESESAQMSNVYGLAACTIAAAAGMHVTDAMYRHRDPRKVRPCLIKIQNRWATVYPHRPEKLVAAAF